MATPMPEAGREEVEWRPATTPRVVSELLAGGVDPLLAPLLARRGVGSVAEAEEFLRPSVGALHPPMGLAGMAEAVERLLAALRDGERIVIVGDYDVDGVSATALLAAVLRAHGADVDTLLPHRLRDGYGFQETQVERAREAGASLIVTVDCGTASKPAIESALASGIDVIVTDHHLPGEDFPRAAIQVNPRLPSCAYPFPELCGVGIALKLALALSERSGRALPLAPLLRIAALGTIADLVPLVGENRVIAALGLEALASTRSEGLRSLFRVAGVRPPLRADDVGYRLGPRINAAGRLDSAEAALELLLCRDPARAQELAERLDSHNRERQEEEQRVVEEAREQVLARHSLPGILMLWSEGWHRGVVGIAASRLVREFHRPALLLAHEGELATGSGRSIPGIGLHGFLDRFRDHYLRFGGHEAAVGLTVAGERLEPLRDRLEEAAAAWPAEQLRRSYEYELRIGVDEVTPELFRRLARLEPHGAGNRRPLLRVGPISLPAAPVLFGESHAKVRGVPADGSRGGLWLIAWRWAERAERLQGTVDALGHLTWDDYLSWPVLTVEDVRPAAE